MAADAILNIRVPRELATRIEGLAEEWNVPKSSAARLLLRRALGEPIGLAVIREKVMQIHALMRARQAQISSTLRELLTDMVEELAPGDDVDLPEMPSAEEHQAAQLEERFEQPIEDVPEEQDWVGDIPIEHGISGRKKTGDAMGRRKQRG